MDRDAQEPAVVQKRDSGSSATITAALIGGGFAVLAAVLPNLFANRAQVTSSPPVVAGVAPIETLPLTTTSVVRPNLLYGAWTILASKDDAGTDWTNSTLKFTAQQETVDGLK